MLRCACGSPLDAEHSFPSVSRALFDDRLGTLDGPHASGVWRFHELIHPGLPADAVVTRFEGNTPLYASPAVARFVGLGAIRLKHEGHNPSGSFKDRGMTAAVSHAVHHGAKILACASTGNTSASLASYAAVAGVKAAILVPAGKIALGKMSQALAYGATTLIVEGDFDAAMTLVQQGADELGLTLLNSLNPFRVEGQKTIILETIQQLSWEAPDWFVFPAGNLGNCGAFGKALREAKQLGLIDKVPRLLAVQAAGAAPFAAAFDRDFDRLEPVAAETIATAIRIGNPVSYQRAIRSIRETGGHVMKVDDGAIMAAKAVVDAAGIGAEPASCASVAGAKQAVASGLIKPTDRVACLLTGHLLKDPGATIDFHQGDAPSANKPITIQPTLSDLARALGL
jgi:threonine synthase